jgi:hypothetical protein
MAGLEKNLQVDKIQVFFTGFSGKSGFFKQAFYVTYPVLWEIELFNILKIFAFRLILFTIQRPI